MITQSRNELISNVKTTNKHVKYCPFCDNKLNSFRFSKTSIRLYLTNEFVDVECIKNLHIIMYEINTFENITKYRKAHI